MLYSEAVRRKTATDRAAVAVQRVGEEVSELRIPKRHVVRPLVRAQDVDHVAEGR